MHSKKRQAQITKNRRGWIARNPGKAKGYNLLAYYGITLDHFNLLWARQKGRCAICGSKLAAVGNRHCMDHDHKEKTPRGILCNHCNLALGHFKDDPRLLAKATKYLLSYKQAKKQSSKGAV